MRDSMRPLRLAGPALPGARHENHRKNKRTLPSHLLRGAQGPSGFKFPPSRTLSPPRATHLADAGGSQGSPTLSAEAGGPNASISTGEMMVDTHHRQPTTDHPPTADHQPTSRRSHPTAHHLPPVTSSMSRSHALARSPCRSPNRPPRPPSSHWCSLGRPRS